MYRVVEKKHVCFSGSGAAGFGKRRVYELGVVERVLTGCSGVGAGSVFWVYRSWLRSGKRLLDVFVVEDWKASHGCDGMCFV